MVRWVFSFVLAAALVVAGCDDSCESDSDCPDGSYCDGGLCLAGSPDDGKGGTGGAGGTGGSGNTGGTGGTGGTGNTGGTGGGQPCDDADGDGACDDRDNCPGLANPGQEDGDGDGAGDGCDPCPTDPDDDGDDDGFCANHDNCPVVANPDQADLDGDGKGDACDGDIDGDDVANHLDCAPDDPGVFPGAPDPCDGADTDCAPGFCWIPVGAPDGEALDHLSCLPDGRCAALTSSASTGSLLLLDLASPEPLAVVAADGALGVALVAAEEAPVAWVVGDDRLRAVALAGNGQVLATVNPEPGTLIGPIAASSAGDAMVAALDASRYLVLDPGRILREGAMPSCTDARCRVVDLSTAWTTQGALGAKTAYRVGLLPRTEATRATAFLSFEDSRQVAASNFAAEGLFVSWTGFVDTFRGAPVELAIDQVESRVFLLNHDGQVTRVDATDPQGLEKVTYFFPGSVSCPTALGYTQGRLWIGDACEGDEPRLLSVTLDDDGLPSGDPAIQPLPPGCIPGSLAPQVPSGAEPYLVVTCRGGDTVVAVNRD